MATWVQIGISLLGMIIVGVAFVIGTKGKQDVQMEILRAVQDDVKEIKQDQKALTELNIRLSAVEQCVDHHSKEFGVVHKRINRLKGEE